MKFLNIKIIVVFLFLLSGICGLIYEVAWSKYLALFIGSSGYSHIIVLATFMGGLALGAFVTKAEECLDLLTSLDTVPDKVLAMKRKIALKKDGIR